MTNIQCEYNSGTCCVVGLQSPCGGASGPCCRSVDTTLGGPAHEVCNNGLCCDLKGYGCQVDADCCSGSCGATGCL